jgi:hypothetical protein
VIHDSRMHREAVTQADTCHPCRDLYTDRASLCTPRIANVNKGNALWVPQIEWSYEPAQNDFKAVTASSDGVVAVGPSENTRLR